MLLLATVSNVLSAWSAMVRIAVVALVMKSMKIFAGPSCQQKLSTESICLQIRSYQREVLGKGHHFTWSVVVLAMTPLPAETLLGVQRVLYFPAGYLQEV